MNRKLLVAVVAMTCIALQGCLGPDEGNLITGLAKVSSGTMTTLTPTEVTLLVDQIGTLNPTLAIEVDRAQATAAVDFLKQNNLNTVADIERLVNNPGSVVIPDSIVSLVQSGDIPEIPDTVAQKF